MRWIYQILGVIVLCVPSLFALGWTCLPALRALWASHTLVPPTLAEADWDDAQQVLELRRDIQRHFLHHDVYVPIEDILTPAQSESGRSLMPSLMQNACGRARLYVWIPIKLRLPLVGDKVYEWCWKPRMA